MVTIRLRRGSAAEWTASNPTLALGEPGWETDTGRIKIGTGSTAWVSLPYYAPSPHTHSAADITSGTLADGRLSSNVPLKNVAETFSDELTVEKHLKVNGTDASIGHRESAANLGRLISVGGGYFNGTASTYTGAITIKLPTASYGLNSMISFWVDVFDYATGESFSIYLAGYEYVGSPSGNQRWVSPTAVILTNRPTFSPTVQFTTSNADDRSIVYIGGLADTWAYIKVCVRDVLVGQSANWHHYREGWEIGFESSAFENNGQGAIATIADPLPYAKPMAASEIFSAVLGLDGPGTGLHADLFDTYEASAFPRKLENAVIDAEWTFDSVLNANDDFDCGGTGIFAQGLSVTGNSVFSGTINSRNIATDGTKLDGIAAGATQGLGAASQVLAEDRTITNAAGGQYLLVNLTASGGKSAILSVAPTNPSLALSINDGAGQAAALQFGSAGAFWTMTGAMDWRINTDPGELHSVFESQGSSAAPKWARDMPTARYIHTDFTDRNVHTNDPFFGTAIASGTQSATPPVWALAAFGACNMRSSTTANSGWRWQTHTGAFYGKSGMYFRARLGIPDDMTNKTVRFGFLNTTTQADAADGTYFELTAGSLVCTPKSANSSSRTSGSTYTLSVDTYYIFEIEWTSDSSVNFKISSEDGSTVHLDTDITTDLPSAYPRVFGAGIVATSSGTAVDDLVCIDYMGIGLRGAK